MSSKPPLHFYHCLFPHSHSFTEETRSSFIRTHSPDSELHDQAVLPVIEHSNFQDNGTFFTCRPVSSHLKVIKEKAESTSGAQTAQGFLVSRNSARNEIKDGVDPGSQVNMSCAVQRTDGSKLCQQKESETTDNGRIQSVLSNSGKKQESSFNASKLVNLQEKGMEVILQSEEVSGVSAGQQSSRGQKQKGQLSNIYCNNSSCTESSIRWKREESNLLLELNMNTTASRKKSDFLFASLCDNMKANSCPDTAGEQFVEEDMDNTPTIQEMEPSHLGVNQDASVKDQVERHHPARNPQEMEHHTEQSLMEPETSDLDSGFVEAKGSEEADSNAVLQTVEGLAMQLEDLHNKVDEGPERSAQLEESGDGGVPLIPPAGSLRSTSPGKYGFSGHY